MSVRAARRTARQFAGERFRRLFIPFLVCSLLLHPFQEYLKWVHKGWFKGPFIGPEFLSRYIDSRPGPPPAQLLNPDFAYQYAELLRPTVFREFGEHLWFLGFLFSFSLISLPFFLWLKKDAGKRFITILAGLAERRGGILLFILPTALSRILLQPFYPDYTDWSDFSFMLVFFILGYILYANERFQQIIRRDWLFGLSLGSINTIVIVFLLAMGVGVDWVKTPGTPGFYLAWALMSINAWCWVVVALYLGLRYLSARNKRLVYGENAMMPFYLFHHPVIVIIAFFVVQWDAGILMKLPVVVLSSFVITLGIYELIIKRIRALQVFFGMKAKV